MKQYCYIIACFLVFAGCRKTEETGKSGKIKFIFTHTIQGQTLLPDSMIYHTASHYDYKVTDLQYFISDIILYHNGGQPILLRSDNGIHYVDVRLPSTQSWTLGDEIPPGTFDSLSFTFGINAAKNTSNHFPNPPERDMAWPVILGGGYHYLKMNLMYKNPPDDTIRPFMFHLGIGQIYSTPVPDPDSITGYIQNYFSVTLNTRFAIGCGALRTIQITMLVDRWFDGPETFDFSDYPNGIMQYQAGMHKACTNGKQAFTGSVVK